MSTAIGWQHWDARPMSTIKVLDSNPGFEPQVEKVGVEKKVVPAI